MSGRTTEMIRVDSRFADMLKRQAARQGRSVTRYTERLVTRKLATKRRKARLQKVAQDG